MKTILLCTGQNIPLHGHRGNAIDLERDVLDSDNHGNFLALLIKAGDRVLGEHLSIAARNATYTSNTNQNQIVDVFSHQVKKQIIQKVKEAKW